MRSRVVVAHFWGEVSDPDTMGEALARLDKDPDCALALCESAGFAARWTGLKKKL